MGKRTYRDALDARLCDLADRTALLALRWEHAAGIEKFRTFQEIQRLQRRRRALEDRRKQLECGDAGFWQDIKADAQAMADDLRHGIERWIERLDRNHRTRSPGTTVASPGSVPFASTRRRT